MENPSIFIKWQSSSIRMFHQPMKSVASAFEMEKNTWFDQKLRNGSCQFGPAAAWDAEMLLQMCPVSGDTTRASLCWTRMGMLTTTKK